MTAKTLAKRLEAIGGMPVIQSGGLKATFNSGSIELGGAKTQALEVIIVSAVQENTYYEGAYDPNTPSSPTCYSRSHGTHPMVPDDEALSPQHTTCVGCPRAEWGSGANGKGKACKERIRMAFIPATDDAEQVAGAQMAVARAPVTSTQQFGAYTQALSARGLQAPLQVTTKISTSPHPKWGNVTQVSYTAGKENSDAVTTAVLDRINEASDWLYRGYE